MRVRAAIVAWLTAATTLSAVLGVPGPAAAGPVDLTVAGVRDGVINAIESLGDAGELGAPALLGTTASNPPTPAAAPGTAARFAVIGDYGSDLPQEATVAGLVDGLAPDFVVTTGDNLYSLGGASPATYDNRVGQYYSDYIGDYTGAYGPGSVTNRFFPSPGNHDYSDIGASDDLAEYEAFFTLPGTGIPTSDTSGSERYYDFLQGPVHFFVLDSQAILSSSAESTAEAAWLQNGLAASTAPWQAVVLHHAPYSSSAAHGSTPALQWPFATWGADVVFAGHDHTYERLTVDGIPYIISGLGGKSIYGIGATLPESQAHYTADYGTVIVDACTAGMTMTFYSVSEGPIDTGQVGAGCALPSDPWTVTSPSGGISMSVELVSGSLQYTVSRDGTLVVQSSDLGIQRTDTSFGSGLTVQSVSAPVTIDETYSVPHGKASQLLDHATERTLEFSNTAGKRIQLIMRAYDDGVAFRYRFPETNAATFTVTNELTTFFIAADGRALLQQRWPESLHDIVPTESPPGGVGGWAMPALFDLGHSWVMLAESDVDESFYAAQIDKAAGNREYRIRMPENDYGTKEPSWTLPWEMPWRVIMVGADVDTIIESDVVSHLADPSQIIDTSWVVPGRVSWHWWSGAWVGDMSALEDYVDFAQSMGWEYSLIDANWDQHNTDQEMQDLIDYAAARGVGIILWYNSAGPHNSANLTPRDKMWDNTIREAEMAKLASWGVKGIKVDFFDSEKQVMVQHYLDILEDAAAEEIMVLFHGSTTPRGWYRTWPNMMTTEAVRGAEYYRGPQSASFPADAPLHNVEVAFTRNVVGPMDYTPVTFSDNTVGQTVVHQTTNGHELALSVVYESGLVHLADSIASYQAQPQAVQDFLKDVPAAWDEIRYLEGDPASHIVLARRRGNDWYLGGINGVASSRPVSIDLTQFGYGGSGGTLIADGATNRTFASSAITGTTLNVTMAARGGFVAQLSAAGTPVILVGDSITEGTGGDTSYRCDLWTDLAAGDPVDFVGLRPPVGTCATPGFDADHDGTGGATTAQRIGDMDTAGSFNLTYEAALVHLGTNDKNGVNENWNQTYLDTVIEPDFRTMVARLRQNNPNVTIYLPQIIPCDFGPGGLFLGCSVTHADMNARWAKIAADSSTPTSPIVLIDHTRGFDGDIDNPPSDLKGDRVHPNESGRQKMADNWALGLETFFAGVSLADPVSATGSGAVPWTPSDTGFGGRPLTCSVVPDLGEAARASVNGNCSGGSFDATGLSLGQYTFRYGATDFGVEAHGSATHFGEVTVTVTASGSQIEVFPGDDIQAIVNANPAGSQFLLRSGVHRMQQVLARDGDVFTGEPGTVLNGSRVLSGWIQDGSRWYVTGQTQEGAIRGSGSCDPGYERCGRPEELFVDDVTYRHVTTLGAVGPGSWFFDYPGNRIYLGENPAGKVVETAVTPTAIFGAVDGVQVRSLVVEKYANPAQSGAIDSRASIDGAPGLNWVVDGVEARLNHGSGIHITDGGRLANSYLHHNGQQGFGARGTNILVEGNEIAFNNTARFRLDWEGGGNKLVGTELVLRNNYSHDNYGTGIWIDINSFDVLMEGNVLEDNYRAGIFFEVSNTATIRNNYAEGNGLDDSRAQDWLWASGILVGSSLNAEIYGNTVVNNGNGITATQQDRGNGPWGFRRVENLNVHDNTITMAPDTISPFTQSRTGAVQDMGDNAIFTTRNNTFQDNTYRADPGTDRFSWLNGNRTFTDWQSYGLDVTGSITPITTAPPTWSSSLTATAATPSTITLNWSGAADPDGIGAYRIYESTIGRVATTAGATTVTVRFLDPATTYAFTVEAVDAMGNESATGPSTLASTSGGGGGGQTPVVTIETPVGGASFLEGEPIEFTASVVDNETGLEANVVWSSIPDGVTGTGATISASSLQLGTYLVTARATDSDGLTGSATITVHVVADGLVVWLPLDEGSGTAVADASGSGNDATLVGGAAFTADSNDGSAFSVDFDGVDGWVDMGAVDVSGTGLTIAAHFRADSFLAPANDGRLISKAAGTSDNDHIFMLSTALVDGETRLRGRVRVGGATTTVIADSGALSVDTWYHGALTYDGSRVRLFLDGVEVGSIPLSGAVDQDPGVVVAGAGQPPTAGNRFWDGRVDDIRIYERGLSPAEVASLAANAVPVAVDGAASTTVGAPVDVVLSGTDVDDDALTFTIVAGPLHGQVGPVGPVDCTGVSTCTAVVTYTPDPGFDGSDSFTFRVADSWGVSAVATVQVAVDGTDTTKPVIVLIGDNPMMVEVFSPFVDPGATVTDDTDPTTTVYGVGAVDVDVVGTYLVDYDYTDAAGNVAATVTREVVVGSPVVPVGVVGVSDVDGGGVDEVGVVLVDGVGSVVVLRDEVTGLVRGEFVVPVGFGVSDVAVTPGGDVAVLVRDVTDGGLGVWVFGVSGGVSEFVVGTADVGVDLEVTPLGGLAVLTRRSSDGLVRVWLVDAGSGAVAEYSYGKTSSGTDLEVTPSGGLAVLGTRPSDGKVRVVVVDPGSGSIEKSSFGKTYSGTDLEVTSSGGLAVLGSRPSDEQVRVVVVTPGVSVSKYVLGKTYSGTDVEVTPSGDLAVLGSRADGNVRVGVVDPGSGSVTKFFTGSTYSGEALVATASGLLGVLGQAPTDGSIRVQMIDPVTTNQHTLDY